MKAKIVVLLVIASVGIAAGATVLWSRPVTYVSDSFSKKAVSPDGRFEARGDVEKGSVSLCDRSTGQQRILRKEPSRKQSEWCFVTLAFSPDGTILAAGGGSCSDRRPANGREDNPDEGSIVLWDVTTGEERATFEMARCHALCMAFSPDGKKLVAGDFGASLWLWDVDRRERLYLELPRWLDDFSIEWPIDLAFSPDGKTLGRTSAGASASGTSPAGRTSPPSNRTPVCRRSPRTERSSSSERTDHSTIRASGRGRFPPSASPATSERVC